MSQTTLPSASQQPGADGVRIKRLERELAESKSLHTKALDDIDSYETEKESLKATIGLKERVIRDLIGAKDRLGVEIEADYAKKNRPTGPGNEKDDKVVKQLQAKNLELQNTLIARDEARDEEVEMLREQNGELRGRIQMLKGRLPRVLSYAEQYPVDAVSSEGPVARQAHILRRVAEVLENNSGPPQVQVELLTKLREECILETADFALPAETAPLAKKLGKVKPERVARSSAETELLRLKNRKTLNRLTPF